MLRKKRLSLSRCTLHQKPWKDQGLHPRLKRWTYLRLQYVPKGEINHKHIHRLKIEQSWTGSEPMLASTLGAVEETFSLYPFCWFAERFASESSIALSCDIWIASLSSFPNPPQSHPPLPPWIGQQGNWSPLLLCPYHHFASNPLPLL